MMLQVYNTFIIYYVVNVLIEEMKDDFKMHVNSVIDIYSNQFTNQCMISFIFITGA